MSKESAEEKLLKMMQKSASSVAIKPPVQGALKKKFKLSFSINALNSFLFLGILACIIALGLEMRSGIFLLNQEVEFSPESKADVALSDIALPSIPSANYYLQKINGRNIFKPYVLKTVQKVAAQDFAQRMSRYKLVGIAWLDLPETASIMIEDRQKKETLFLKQGEQLEGVTVKTIYTDRAVFSHENEETTIKL
ncbi:MAG: hypothetical protein HQL12_05710 [Candidatus Omnitrophica bacterium]|nr:hypothetical protein [Candidatus Omnitrophota bacterium]